MDLSLLTDENLDYITILQQKENKKDLMYAALEFCAKKKYKNNIKEYNYFINNLSNENYLIAHIDNLLKTAMFLIWCCECDNEAVFEKQKNDFLKQTLALKKNTPTLFEFRVFYIDNNEKISSHVEHINELKKMRYFKRIDPIINYLSTI